MTRQQRRKAERMASKSINATAAGKKSKEVLIDTVGNMSIENQKLSATKQGADCFIDTVGTTWLLENGKWVKDEVVVDEAYLKQFKEVGAALGMNMSHYTIDMVKQSLKSDKWV